MRAPISGGRVNITSLIKDFETHHETEYDKAVHYKQEALGRKVSMRLTCVRCVITESDSTVDGLNSALQKAVLHKEESIMAAMEEMLKVWQIKNSRVVLFYETMSGTCKRMYDQLIYSSV